MNAMLRGDVAPITMNQCANVHGYKMVQAFADIHELWDDVKYALDALCEFRGGTMREKAISVIAHFDYLKMSVQIAETNEKAAQAAFMQEYAEKMALRSRLRYARAYLLDVPGVPTWVMGEIMDGGAGHEKDARQETTEPGSESQGHQPAQGAGSEADRTRAGDAACAAAGGDVFRRS